MDRRKVMIGGAALLGTASLGGVYIVTNDRTVRTWIETLVARHLPGSRIDPPSLAAFSDDKLAEIGHNPNYRIYAASLSAGIDISTLSGALRDKVEAFERKIVSDFLLGSNFFFLDDPRMEPVTYDGEAPIGCRNPFAVFD
ncbi:hypothetical protein [Hyphomicrobium sp.]|uniref:hypothetical protein n=1 Tax=Hyphomicrobium sp. TaxID=82 RepID=UPI0025BB07F0|nr:hypothetical protein [Hyphomicrobium sp.]MCC7251287.1 hypothetical protein [Hyphomicrobium sp.]